MLHIKPAFVFDCIRVCVPSGPSPSTKRIFGFAAEPVSTVNSHYTDKTVFLGGGSGRPGDEANLGFDVIWRQEFFDVARVERLCVPAPSPIGC